jgi:hypothetical protein
VECFFLVSILFIYLLFISGDRIWLYVSEWHWTDNVAQTPDSSPLLYAPPSSLLGLFRSFYHRPNFSMSTQWPLPLNDPFFIWGTYNLLLNNEIWLIGLKISDCHQAIACLLWLHCIILQRQMDLGYVIKVFNQLI